MKEGERRREKGEKGREGENGSEISCIPAFELFSMGPVFDFTDHEGCQVTKFMGKDVEKTICQSS